MFKYYNKDIDSVFEEKFNDAVKKYQEVYENIVKNLY